jgi:hypothetical protein
MLYREQGDQPQIDQDGQGQRHGCGPGIDRLGNQEIPDKAGEVDIHAQEQQVAQDAVHKERDPLHFSLQTKTGTR